MKKLIVIENEVVEVVEIYENGFDGFNIECDNGNEYMVFDSHETAGKKAREYWEDMAKNYQEEFRYIVGDNALIQWCLGNMAGPGSTHVSSLNEWFDLWLDTPEEQWAGYDSVEIEGAQFNNHFRNKTGFNDKNSIVLYRTN